MRALLPLAAFFGFAASMVCGDPVTQAIGCDNVHVRVSYPAKLWIGM